MTEKITRDRVEDAWQWWPAAAEFHSRMGHVEVWNIACISRGAVIASMGLGFDKVPEPDSVDSVMLLALAQQATLALELNRLSEEAKQQVVTLEREKAEHRRLAELVKTTAALKQTLDVVASEPNLNRVLGHVLTAITLQLESQSSALWLVDSVSGRFRIHSVFQEGRVVSAKEDLRILNGAWGRRPGFVLEGPHCRPETGHLPGRRHAHLEHCCIPLFQQPGHSEFTWCPAASGL